MYGFVRWPAPSSLLPIFSYSPFPFPLPSCAPFTSLAGGTAPLPSPSTASFVRQLPLLEFISYYCPRRCCCVTIWPCFGNSGTRKLLAVCVWWGAAEGRGCWQASGCCVASAAVNLCPTFHLSLPLVVCCLGLYWTVARKSMLRKCCTVRTAWCALPYIGCLGLSP